MIAKLTLLLVGIAAASGNPAAGKSWQWKSPKPLVTPSGPGKSSRIVGGEEATPHSWPHEVALFVDDLYFCSGSLISSEWVLTAAHCIDGAAFVEVVMGAHNIQQNEPTQVSMTSTNFFVHEDYSSLLLSNDISLIRLPNPVTFNDYIQAICLPSSDVNEGDLVTIIGWGKESDSSIGISNVLREVTVPVISSEDCNSVYGIIGAGVFCTDGAGGMGTCSGDSGSSVIKDGCICGITSFGPSSGCEAGYPDAITSVYYYLDWIESHTGITL